MNLRLVLSQKNSPWIRLITRELNEVPKYNLSYLLTCGMILLIKL